MPAHSYRRHDIGWTFEWVAGPDAAVELPSATVTVPLAALYEGVQPDEA
jgi:hypothetical protein